jgi:hypothetical protein
MNRDTRETAQNGAGADNAPPDAYHYVRANKTAPCPVSASRSGIDSEAKPPDEALQHERAAPGSTRRAPMSATRRKAFEPLIDWMAKQILDVLLEEKRLELEAERQAQGSRAAPS